jgi:23S rRNA (cytosine1962-C5)-methyltransferase
MDRSRRDTRAIGAHLVDAGDGRRLEQLGARLVDRPAPMAAEPPKLPRDRWLAADLRFDPAAGWTEIRSPGPGAPEPWEAEVAGLRLELRPTTSGGVGVYLEHASNVGWLEEAVRRVSSARGSPLVLNLFAHTGLATLAAARAGASVVHVDAARSAVAWARRNAELNGLESRHIRWIVDDALAFVEREGRRGHRYDGVVMDPPSFGRSRGGSWQLREDLEALLMAVARITAPGAFGLVTAHTTGLDPAELERAVAGTIGRASGGRTRGEELELVAASGARLRLGASVFVDPS